MYTNVVCTSWVEVRNFILTNSSVYLHHFYILISTILPLNSTQSCASSIQLKRVVPSYPTWSLCGFRTQMIDSFHLKVFRNKSSTTPLCNIQMPNVEVYSPTDFNIKIIFHPHTGITEEEQLLCTAAAIAFVNIRNFFLNFGVSALSIFRWIFSVFPEIDDQTKGGENWSRRHWLWVHCRHHMRWRCHCGVGSVCLISEKTWLRDQEGQRVCGLSK